MTQRLITGLLMATFFFLAGCGGQPLLVPQPVYGYPGYRGTAPYYGGGWVYGVATPTLGQSRIGTGNSFAGNSQEVMHPAVLAMRLQTAGEQLRIHCNADTLRMRATEETAATTALGAVLGGIANGRNGAIGGALLGATVDASSGTSFSYHKCQLAVNWHHELLTELSRTLNATAARCEYREHAGRQSRECFEQAWAAWRK